MKFAGDGLHGTDDFRHFLEATIAPVPVQRHGGSISRGACGSDGLEYGARRLEDQVIEVGGVKTAAAASAPGSPAGCWRWCCGKRRGDG